jgi:hypothetical protein
LKEGRGCFFRKIAINSKKPSIMDYVEHFTELEVYQLCRQLSKEVFEISKTFPKEELYSLTDQVRRSSRSIGGQIAEAWGKRKCHYITQGVSEDLTDRYGSVHRMLKSMMEKSSSFCSD